MVELEYIKNEYTITADKIIRQRFVKHMKKIGIGVLVIVVISLIVGLGIKFQRSSAIGIIGGADGPTSVIVGEVQEKNERETVAQVFSVEHEPQVNNWGVTLTAKNASPIGMTIVCTQSGYDVKGELFTGSSFSLSRLVDGEWKDVEYLPQEHEVAWTSEAWIIPLEGTVEWETNWEWLYGELPQGRYRLGKGIMNLTEPGNFETCMQFVEFEVGN